MSYTVLARKYRPQKFSDVIGQEHVTALCRTPSSKAERLTANLQRTSRHWQDDRGAHPGHGAELPLL